MKISPKNIILLFLLGLSSYWLYPTIQGFWSLVYMPPPEGIRRSIIPLCAWLTIFAALGSLLCALVLGLPLGFFAKERPIFLGGILALIICTLNLFYLWNYGFYQFHWFTSLIRIGEYSALIVASILFAKLGCRLAMSNNK